MKIGSYFRVASNTTLNIILYAATTGKYLWLEGRVRRGVFRNWARRFKYAPITYAEPSSEEEILRIVRSSRKVRVFGSGHSFNEGNVSDQVLISMDNYSGLVSKDLANDQITVRGGTRVRDVVKLLAQDGLAFAALPSHDAQSIAGILSTDVHGTGRALGLRQQLRRTPQAARRQRRHYCVRSGGRSVQGGDWGRRRRRDHS